MELKNLERGHVSKYFQESEVPNSPCTLQIGEKRLILFAKEEQTLNAEGPCKSYHLKQIPLSIELLLKVFLHLLLSLHQ